MGLCHCDCRICRRIAERRLVLERRFLRIKQRIWLPWGKHKADE
jgi:hypothetical protein